MTDSKVKIARRSKRFSLEVPVRVKNFGASIQQKMTLSDLSAVGCQLAPASGLRTGTQLLIKIPGLEYWPATVMWKRGERVGVEFARSLHPTAVEDYAKLFID